MKNAIYAFLCLLLSVSACSETPPIIEIEAPSSTFYSQDTPLINSTEEILKAKAVLSKQSTLQWETAEENTFGAKLLVPLVHETLCGSGLITVTANQDMNYELYDLTYAAPDERHNNSFIRLQALTDETVVKVTIWPDSMPFHEAQKVHVMRARTPMRIFEIPLYTKGAVLELTHMDGEYFSSPGCK